MKKKTVSIILSTFFSLLSIQVQALESNKFTNPKESSLKSRSIIKVIEENEESTYKPNFIKAADLLKKMQRKENVVLIDVRGKVAYDEAHIKGALLKDLPITAETSKGIPKDAHIVTYCGCPHHLSSIGAEQLTNLGFKDVHVLDEGYVFWKDNKYPLSKDPSDTKEISISGVLLKNKKPFSNVDIFLKHESTGQMEATRTAKDGSYKMIFHIYKYKDKDKFKFYVKDLKKPIQDFSTAKKDTTNVIVNVK